MLVERIENRWLAAFTRTFTLCKVQPGEVVAILAETQSRRVNVDLARLALEAMGAKVFELTLTTPPLTAPAPVRSTGASDAIGQLGRWSPRWPAPTWWWTAPSRACCTPPSCPPS
jgi:2,5-dihydroxypyridine 5,6-dioxygenase